MTLTDHVVKVVGWRYTTKNLVKRIMVETATHSCKPRPTQIGDKSGN